MIAFNFFGSTYLGSMREEFLISPFDGQLEFGADVQAQRTPRQLLLNCTPPSHLGRESQ